MNGIPLYCMTQPSPDTFEDQDEAGEEMSEELWVALVKMMKAAQSHSGYFSLKGNENKPLNEVSAVREWLNACKKYQTEHFKLERPRLDPPDAILINDKVRLGIEVTEFVDKDARSKTAKREKKCEKFLACEKIYGETEFHSLIKTIISKKAAKQFKDTSCTSKILIIYSAELFDPNFLSSLPPVNQSFFDEIWFISPPVPNISAIEIQNPHCQIFEVRSG